MVHQNQIYLKFESILLIGLADIDLQVRNLTSV